MSGRGRGAWASMGTGVQVCQHQGDTKSGTPRTDTASKVDWRKTWSKHQQLRTLKRNINPPFALPKQPQFGLPPSPLTMSLPAGRWPVRSTSGILMATFSTDVPFLAAFRASSLATACLGCFEFCSMG